MSTVEYSKTKEERILKKRNSLKRHNAARIKDKIDRMNENDIQDLNEW